MKRIVLKILPIVLVCLLAACGSNPEKTYSNTEIEKLLEGEIMGEITISCYDAMLYEKFLNEAAGLFENEHPGTKINVKVFSKMPEIKTKELEDGSIVAVTDGGDDSAAVFDYISRINAELMSGHGADLLAVDVLPYYKYAESGLLEDLSLYMDADKDFDVNDYKIKIIEATRYKGGQYIMPLDFAYEFYSYDKNRVDEETGRKLREKSGFTYWEMTDLIKEQFSNDDSGSRVIDFQEGVNRAFRYLFRIDYKKYIDLENKKANFKDGKFVQLVKEIKEQNDNGYFVPGFSTSEEQTKDFIESQRLYYYKQQIDMTLKSVFYPREDMFQSSSFPIPEIDEIIGLMVNDAGEASFRSYQNYGINYNSPNKKLAWEFLKFLIGEEMQQSFNLLGNPVNNAAFIEYSKLEMIKTANYTFVNEGDYTVDGYTELTEEKYVAAYENYMVYLNSFVESLGSYPITDTIINDMVAKETSLFFSGDRTAEEVADALQNKVQLYLDE